MFLEPTSTAQFWKGTMGTNRSGMYTGRMERTISFVSVMGGIPTPSI